MPVEAKLNKQVQRKRVLDDKKLDMVLKRISGGSPYKIASYASGFSYRTFKSILLQGMLDLDHDIVSMESKFVEKLKILENDQIESCVADIRGSEKGHAGAQWFIERKYWRDFSSRAENLQLAEEMEELKNKFMENEKLKGN